MNRRISASDWQCITLVDLLRQRAIQQPENLIYSFLTDGEIAKEQVTHADLDRQARNIGTMLQASIAPGERALLIYPSGLEFIAAFFGCLYSGIIAVPVYPPTAGRSDRTLSKFRAVAKNAEPAVILTASSFQSKVTGLLAQTPELNNRPLVITDQIGNDEATRWQEPTITGNTLAFLQYTSGSTGTPKGVMVSHANLLHNSALIERYCEHPDDAHAVTWLPLYHDLGLIGGVLQPLYAGFASTIMAPAAFLQRPIRWLEALSHTRGTYSGGPNFAFDLCVRKVTEEQKARLDLSNWDLVANGAEPVHLATLERFADAFASCGFRRQHTYPCYGLAEATLVVSAGKKGTFPTVRAFQAQELAQHRVHEATTTTSEARSLVSIGKNHLDQQKVLIVDPETHQECPPDSVGEIWVAGPSVAQGYWQRPQETTEVFHATLANGTGPFLRTGDLGFRNQNELFITGRLKDLIVIRGSNHYPQDIEQTVEQCHTALRSPGAGAAFSIEADSEEQLVVVHEVERHALTKNLDNVIATIRRTIAEQHDLQVYAIALIKPASLPKTSSGKVQRRGTREAYLDGSLAIVREWKLTPDAIAQSKPATTSVEPPITEPASSSKTSQSIGKTKAEVQSWLVEHVALELKVTSSDLDVRAPLAQYGLDSVRAIMLSADLEEWLGREVPATLLYDYPNIDALARHLGVTEVALLKESTFPVHDVTEDAIAIIGLGCRFPGADSPEAFWHLLHNGIDGISEVPASRWDLERYYATDPAIPGKMNTRWGGFLAGIEQFDPYFFSISPREAARMDPQQRLLLEVAWETLEYAGIAPESLAGSQTGVFVGISSNDYAHLQYQDPRFIDAYAGTGNAHSIAANRLSYVLDLRGPSLAIDTACSSSLVAVHQACQALRNGECDLALAGGVNLILTPDLTITFAQARMMSSDGRCKTFDESADGYVRGEGCGLVALKPLAAAQRDGDTVLAVIRGSAINQDGRSNGLTAPNGPSQEAVIRRALHMANVTPDQISYVETHGSSTPLGDPIEVDALKAVLMPGRQSDQTCLLGSVKTNIGHLESAAGIAGLIKTVLSLHKGAIAPHLHFQQLNHHISFAGTTFAIPTEPQPWPNSPRRLAGVSAFGFGGTNAHLILEAASTPEVALEQEKSERPAHVLTLSARTPAALQTLAQHYSQYLEQQPATTLADLCATASGGRTHFAHRLAVVATSTKQLHERLTAFGTSKWDAGVTSGQIHAGTGQLAFLFTGQGAQYAQMARLLYETQPAFRQALERCDQILRAHLDRPLLSVIYPQPDQQTPLDETAYTQPALFALEYALAEMWRAWDITPDIVMGHSVGEYVAACIAGVFSLEDGLKLIAARGRLMQALPQTGEMVVVFGESQRVTPLLEPYRDRVTIAALNGPNNTVLSGEQAALQTIIRQLEDTGLVTRRMVVSHAFHSPLMEPMLDEFARIARTVQYQPLQLPLVSNLTGQIMPAGQIPDADYWRTQIRSTVQFAAGMQTLYEHGYRHFLEIGPQAVLTGMGKRCLSDDSITWLSSLRKGQEDWQPLLQSVAALYVWGRELDWTGFERDYIRTRLALPTYPFEREFCWFTTAEAGVETHPSPVHAQQVGSASNGNGRHPLLDNYTALVHPANVHVWETALDRQRLPYLNDHRIQGAVAVPVAVYIEMVRAATEEALGPGTYVPGDLELKKLLLLPEQGAQKVQVVLTVQAEGPAVFHVYSHAAGAPDQPRHAWTLHATGRVHDRLN